MLWRIFVLLSFLHIFHVVYWTFSDNTDVLSEEDIACFELLASCRIANMPDMYLCVCVCVCVRESAWFGLLLLYTWLLSQSVFSGYITDPSVIYRLLDLRLLSFL